MSIVATDGLTREQLAFMRAADERVSFHHHAGRTYCVFGNRAGLQLELDVDGGMGRGYDRDAGHARGDIFTSGFASVTAPGLSGTWQTIVRGIKVGESIALNFLPDYHTNGYVKDAGLHADVLQLVVTPKNGDRAKRRTYTVAVSVCTDNTARMCRR